MNPHLEVNAFQANIDKYKSLLETEMDLTRRTTIMRVIAEERVRMKDLRDREAQSA